MKNKKLLGVPFPIIAWILALSLVVVGAGIFFWQRQVPSTVHIIGGEVEAYQDEACTIPLVDLDFGDLRGGETTGNQTFWIKNTGDDTLYVALSQENLDPLLTLYHEDEGAIPSDPDKLPLAVDWIDWHWQEQGTTGVLTSNLNPSDTFLTLSSADLAKFPDSGMVKVDSEWIAYDGKDGSLQNLLRGQEDSTPAAHTTGTIVYLMEYVGGAVYELPIAISLEVGLYLTADKGITRSDKDFTVNIYAQDTAF